LDLKKEESMGTKEGLSSISEYFICFVFYWFVMVGYHEVVHLNMLHFLGGDGYIVVNWYGAIVHVTQQISNPANFWLVSLLGGLGCGLSFLVIAILNTRADEIEEFSAILPFAGMQLSYGVFEGLFLQSLSVWNYRYYADLASTVGFGIPLVFVLVPWFLFSDRFKTLDRFNLVMTFIRHFQE
jgi:hypothetical protein